MPGRDGRGIVQAATAGSRVRGVRTARAPARGLSVMLRRRLSSSRSAPARSSQAANTAVSSTFISRIAKPIGALAAAFCETEHAEREIRR